MIGLRHGFVVVVAKYATTTQRGAIEDKTQTHDAVYYNLDMILSVDYRVSYACAT